MAALRSPQPRFPAEVRVEVVRGETAVLARLPEVKAIVAGSPQKFELADLPYFLAKPRRIDHDPCLVLLYARQPETGFGLGSGGDQAELVGAVILFEFRRWFLGPRLFSSYSRRGRHTVLAPMENRVEVAAIAAQALLERGARFVNIEIHLGEPDPQPVSRELGFRRAMRLAELRLRGVPGVAAEWAMYPGLKRWHLPLRDTFNATLDTLHQKTRKNLRYHQRRAVRDLGCRFVPSLELDCATFLRLHRECDYPVREEVARWRYESLTRFPHVFFSGLRDAEGKWLALAGGRRSHGEVELDWQINRRHPVISVTTAMRAFLIEHTISAGAASFSLEGGTLTPSVLHSFVQHSVINLAVRRDIVAMRWLLRALVRFMPGKYITRALVKPWRVWKPLPAGKPSR